MWCSLFFSRGACCCMCLWVRTSPDPAAVCTLAPVFSQAEEEAAEWWHCVPAGKPATNGGRTFRGEGRGRRRTPFSFNRWTHQERMWLGLLINPALHGGECNLFVHGTAAPFQIVFTSDSVHCRKPFSYRHLNNWGWGGGLIIHQSNCLTIPSRFN